MKYDLIHTLEFHEWLSDQTPKTEALVLARLSRIEHEGHFGWSKVLGDGLVELKWIHGLRVYFIRISKNKLKILIGGTKHGQEKDIRRARRMLY